MGVLETTDSVYINNLVHKTECFLLIYKSIWDRRRECEENWENYIIYLQQNHMNC